MTSQVKQKKTIEFKSFWQYAFHAEKDHGKPYYLEGLKHHLHQAVQNQLTGDAEIGSFLSAGLDSTAVAAIASKSLPNLHTFTLGFADDKQANIKDERQLAARLAKKIGSQHHSICIGPDHLQKCLKTLVWAVEEPRLGQCYPNFYANQLASRSVKVCLSGTGSDEIFGGYPWRYYSHNQFSNKENYIDHYYHTWHRLLPNKTLHALFGEYVQPHHFQTKAIMRDTILHHLNTSSGIGQSMHFEAITFLQGLLILEDKIGMHHGLESRIPMLDNALVDFAMQIPNHYKINTQDLQTVDENNATQKQYIRSKGKRIFRESLDGILPQFILNQPKQGFTVPDDLWFKNQLKDYVHDTLLSPQAKINDIMNPTVLKNLIHDYTELGTSNRRLLVWSLLYMENWLQLFLTPSQKIHFKQEAKVLTLP